MPDRCVVHGCSNRSNIKAGISAHFSPTIKSERDKWLRFVCTHRANYSQSGKFVPWSQRLSFILSFLFGNLRREALIEAPSPREKKASGQDR